TRNAIAGIATFDDLSIDQAGAGYTIVATSANAGSVTSAPFSITARLISVVPDVIDAAFLNVPFTVNGSGFVIGATTLSTTVGQLATFVYSVQSPAIITGTIAAISAQSASTGTMTVGTPAGSTNSLGFSVFAVGSAPVQLGAANGGGGGTP